MAFKIKNIASSSLFPLRLKYPLDVTENYVYGSDGYSYFNYSFLNQLNDVVAQKESSLLLTKKNNVKNFYKTNKEATNNFNLGLYAYLKFAKSNWYLTGSSAPTVKASRYFSSNDIIYFRINNDNTVSLFQRNFVYTINRSYPYNVTLEKENTNDIYNQQKFEFIQNNKNITLSTILIDNNDKVVKRFLTYSPVDRTVRATGAQFGDYTLNEYYLQIDGDVDTFQPDFLSKSVAVEYYNSLNDFNTKTVEIKNTIPLDEINYLIHVPFKKDTLLTELSTNAQYFEIPAEIIALKNILTPSYTVAKIAAPPVVAGFDPTLIFLRVNAMADYNGKNITVIVNNTPYLASV